MVGGPSGYGGHCRSSDRLRLQGLPYLQGGAVRCVVMANRLGLAGLVLTVQSQSDSQFGCLCSPLDVAVQSPITTWPITYYCWSAY